WVIRPHVERIPAHVRNFQVRIGRRNTIDLARYPAKTGRNLVLAASLGHQLHADANSEERFTLLAHRVLKRIDHPRNFIESTPTICESTDSRQHDTIGARNGIR